MIPFSDIQLISFLNDLESDRVERKRDWAGDAKEKARQAVCAFANDLPGHDGLGILFIGANDDGSGANIEVTDALLMTLSDMKTDGKILPPPTMTVEKRTLMGVQMAVVSVRPSDSPPVRYEGRIWIRIGPRRAIASAQDERILNEKRRWGNRAFDCHPVHGCDLGELDRPTFENQYLPQAVARDVIDANGRTYEERLASMAMIASVDDTTPTVVGVLTLGKSPRTWVACAYVQFVRIRGTRWGDPVVDEQEIDGTLDLILRRLDEKIKASLAVAVDFASGTTTEVRTSPYPLSALQQLTRNAVMHRSYENTNAPVRVYWFDDRIEIQNPGGPFGVVTSENFGRAGVSDYRNPSVAAVLRNFGFVQRFGFGIAEARRALRANGNPPPDFHTEATHVLVTVWSTK